MINCAVVGYRHENKEIRRERLSGPTDVKDANDPAITPSMAAPQPTVPRQGIRATSISPADLFVDFSYNWPATKMFIGLDHR